MIRPGNIVVCCAEFSSETCIWYCDKNTIGITLPRAFLIVNIVGAKNSSYGTFITDRGVLKIYRSWYSVKAII